MFDTIVNFIMNLFSFNKILLLMLLKEIYSEHENRKL